MRNDDWGPEGLTGCLSGGWPEIWKNHGSGYRRRRRRGDSGQDGYCGGGRQGDYVFRGIPAATKLTTVTVPKEIVGVRGTEGGSGSITVPGGRKVGIGGKR